MEDSGPNPGSKSDPLNGKMKVFGYLGVSVPGDLPPQKWVQNGSFWVLRRYFEGTNSLLKRFISLLRARAKVYSSTRSDPNPQGATSFGAIWDPGAAHFPRAEMAKIPHFAVQRVPAPDQVRTRNGPKVGPKWVQNGSFWGSRDPKSGHFEGPDPEIRSI